MDVGGTGDLPVVPIGARGFPGEPIGIYIGERIYTGRLSQLFLEVRGMFILSIFEFVIYVGSIS